MNSIWEGKFVNPKIPNQIELTLKRLDQLIHLMVDGQTYIIENKKNKFEKMIPHLNGKLVGRFDINSDFSELFWIQYGYNFNLGYVQPVELSSLDFNEGVKLKIIPLSDQLTLSVRFKVEEEKLIPIIKNVEMNLGVFLKITQAEIKENHIIFYNSQGESVCVGVLDKDKEQISLEFDFWGTSLDFTLLRFNPQQAKTFYPKKEQISEIFKSNPNGINYHHLRNLYSSILKGENPNIHSLIICHNSKILLEDYFHGFEEKITHDTRSAGKSLASILIGIAIDRGFIVSENQPMLDFFTNYTEIKNWDDRKKKITIKHLMTMSSGLDCDDNNADSVGTEDRMQSQSEELDWYKFALDLPVVNDPGKKGAYGTVAVNLIGGVLTNATEMKVYEFANKYLFKPLNITHYYLNLTPQENGYLGGGIHLKPKDLLKIGKLFLNRGIWENKRIISQTWIDLSLNKYIEVGGKMYGYNWWYHSSIINGKEYESFNAGGNGGQYLILTPELNLVTVMTGGNYNQYGIWSKYITFLESYIIPTIV